MAGAMAGALGRWSAVERNAARPMHLAPGSGFASSCSLPRNSPPAGPPIFHHVPSPSQILLSRECLGAGEREAHRVEGRAKRLDTLLVALLGSGPLPPHVPELPDCLQLVGALSHGSMLVVRLVARRRRLHARKRLRQPRQGHSRPHQMPHTAEVGRATLPRYQQAQMGPRTAGGRRPPPWSVRAQRIPSLVQALFP